MKKLLVVLLVVLVIAILMMAALPVTAASTGWGPTGSQGHTTGGGEPGWSTISNGNGGSGPPEGP